MKIKLCKNIMKPEVGFGRTALVCEGKEEGRLTGVVDISLLWAFSVTHKQYTVKDPRTSGPLPFMKS